MFQLLNVLFNTLTLEIVLIFSKFNHQNIFNNENPDGFEQTWSKFRIKNVVQLKSVRIFSSAKQ